MNEPLILHIETATAICSVALSEGEKLLVLKESDVDRSHAALLTKFIRACFSESNREIKLLSAINVSKGPGSYTGLRIGVSTTKGIAYARNIPVITTGTLKNLAMGSREMPEIRDLIELHGDNLLLCPMLDARRMEVYTAFFNKDGTMQGKVAADIIEENSYSELLKKHKICFFGNGSGKCKTIINHPNAYFVEGVIPSAKHMIPLALEAFKLKQFEDVAYFEPFYLKEFIATIPKKKVL
jgi:tRNA threonylcarbamoyladenosine biosynthesis protein TsaB